MNEAAIDGYSYANARPGHHHVYLLPTVTAALTGVNLPAEQRRIFELGCGNGSMANALSERGWDVTGVDPSAEGITQAQAAYPHLKLEPGSAYDDLAARYGPFPVVLSLEVVEHVYAPRDYARTVFDLLERGGWRSFRPRITATGRTWRLRSPARWTLTSPRSGITGISSSGRSRPWASCCARRASSTSASSASDGCRRWRRR